MLQLREQCGLLHECMKRWRLDGQCCSESGLPVGDYIEHWLALPVHDGWVTTLNIGLHCQCMMGG
jgi:hypothetical protein